MSRYSLVRLGDLCSKITDGTHHSPKSFPVGEFMYVTAKNIRRGVLDLTDVTFVDSATHSEIYSRCDVRRGDVLIVKDGATTGRVAINTLEQPFSLLSSVGVLRAGPAIRPRYLAYALQEPGTANRLLSEVAGVAMTRVTLTKLAELVVPLAPLNEQQRVVDLLDELLPELDDAAAELRTAKVKLAQYRQSLLKAAVEGDLTAEWRASNPPQETGAELLARMLRERPSEAQATAADAAALPATWAWANAAQLCGFITKGTTPPKDMGHGEPKTVPFLRVTNLTHTGALDFSDQVFVSRATHQEFLARSHVVPGDVLMNIVGPPLGQVSLVPEAFPEWNVNQAIAIFRPVSGVSNLYLRVALLSPVAQRWLKARAKTTAGQTNLTLELCRTLPIPLPPLIEQIEIARLVDEVLEAQETLEAEIQRMLKLAAAQRQNILRAAFSGQLVPQDPNDEPAGVLLERIRAERTQPLSSPPAQAPRHSRKTAC